MKVIHVLRNPCSEGTVASNVLRYGTGALNIDRSRVAHSNSADLDSHTKMVEAIKARGGTMENSWKNTSDLSGASDVSALGRWPANLVLQHLDGCQTIGFREEPGYSINRFTDGMKPFGNGAGHDYSENPTPPCSVPVWRCVFGCPVASLDQQSGGSEEVGGASRYFKQFQGAEMNTELAEYLRTMISPEERTLTTKEGVPCVYLHIDHPDTFPWTEHSDDSVHGMTVETESLAGIPNWMPEAHRILKPGAHLMLVAPDEEPTGHTGACLAEDKGFEVRDAILWVHGEGAGEKLHYTPKAARAEREAGLFDSEFDYGQQDESRKEGNPGGDNPRNRGLTKRKNVHPCLHPDALVLTDRGYRPIQTVQVGDKVYGENGKFNTVSHVSHHPHTSPNLYEVTVDGTNYTLLATDNHPFLIWRPTRKGKTVTGGTVMWVPGEEVCAGDYTMTPTPTFLHDAPALLDTEGWFLFGVYLADGVLHRSGHGENRYPSFTVGDTKPHLLARMEAYAASRGVNVGVYPKKNAKAKQVIVFDADLGALFGRLGGSGAEGKALAPEVWMASAADRAALLQGYLLGDGCRVKGRKYLQAKTVSPDLASQLTLLGEEAGYKTCFYRYEGNTGKGITGRKFKSVLPVYHLYFYDQNLAHTEGTTRKPSRPTTITHAGGVFSLRRVASVTPVPYTGEVWNLSVDGSHTFHTPVGMTHNTVKPTEVMVRLLADIPTDKGPIVDPFLGSGTTLLACIETGHNGIGIEREREYLEIADARVRHRDYETAGWNRATIVSDLAPAEEAEAKPQKEQTLDDFFDL